MICVGRYRNSKSRIRTAEAIGTGPPRRGGGGGGSSRRGMLLMSFRKKQQISQSNLLFADRRLPPRRLLSSENNMDSLQLDRQNAGRGNPHSSGVDNDLKMEGVPCSPSDTADSEHAGTEMGGSIVAESQGNEHSLITVCRTKDCKPWCFGTSTEDK